MWARSTTRSTRSARSVEETQERTRKNEGRIEDVDKKADSAAQAASQANSAATTAQSAADAAGSKADAIDKANRRLVYEVVLNDDEGNFKFGKSLLPDSAKQKIDDMVSQLKQDPKNVWIEVEGYTDNVGPKELNEKLGLDARRIGEAVSLRAVPDPAAQDQHDQLRRRQAGRAEQDEGRPRAEPPRGHQGARVAVREGRSGA